MNWYYVDGPHRVGPVSESEWDQLVQSGKIQPGTLVWHEGLSAWTPYSKVPPRALDEPETEPDQKPPSDELEEEESPAAYAARLMQRDYPVRMQSCIGRAWELLRAHFWMLVGSTLLMFAITLVSTRVPGLNWLISLALQGVLFGGLVNVYLRLMRGEPVVTADLAAGFDARVFRDLTLKTLIAFLVSQVCFIPMVYVAIKNGISQETIQAKMMSDPHAVGLFLMAAGAGMIPALFVSFCWMFALPLIVDKGLPVWTAMQLSRRKVMQHPWKVGLLTVTAGITSIVGLIFTLPLYLAATLYLYEDIFSEPPPATPDQDEQAPL